MALYTKAEYAQECGVSRAHISMAIKRGKLIIGDDDKVDSDNALNKLYKATCAENASKKGQPVKVPEIKGKRAPLPKKEKSAPARTTNPLMEQRITQKFDIDHEEKQARIQKIRKEVEMADLKQMKLTGQLIPTDLVFGVIRQLSQSITMSFKNQLEAVVTDISKKAKLDRKESAELRGLIKDHLNTTIGNAVDSAQQHIDNIVKEHSQDRKAA